MKTWLKLSGYLMGCLPFFVSRNLGSDRKPPLRSILSLRRSQVEMQINRIAVVGSRDFQNLDLVRQFVWEQERTTVIISGGAIGVDATAVAEARRLHMPYEVYLPDWNKHGRRAGALRNRQIVDAASEVVAFWDGKSRGTNITIMLAKVSNKPLRVFGSDGRCVWPDAVDPSGAIRGKEVRRA